MFAPTEFIGVDKILAPTKYLRRQNTRLDKILVSKKYSCWQNFCVDKILASTKCWRRHRRIPLLFGSASPQLLTSPRPSWRSPMSPWWCWSLCMQSPSVALLLAALLLWADSRPTVSAYCTGPPCWKPHKFWCQQNIGICLKFTDFRQTIAVYISPHRRPIKKWWKQKVITITVQYQFTYSQPRN